MEVTIFTSPTCGPCKVLKPMLMQMAIEHNFNCLAVEASPGTQAIFGKYEVRSVPTVVVTDGNKELGRFTGVRTQESVFDFLKACAVIE